MNKKLRVAYSRHYRDDAQGHIFLDKEGACTISLVGAASMSQEELDFYGKIMADALANMSPAQIAKIKSFKPDIERLTM